MAGGEIPFSVNARAAEQERKFLVDEAAALAFLRTIAPHVEPLVHDPARPAAWNRTTYFDTDDLAYLRGGWRRLRVREYASAEHDDAPPRLTGDCWLELKETEGTTRAKSRFRAPARVIAELVERGERPASGDDDALAVLAACFREDRPRPVMTSWYRRAAWTATARTGLRITLDRNVEFGPPAEIGAGARPATTTARVPGLILEVKHALDDAPGWLLAALAEVPPQAPLSKYRLGMELVAAARRAPDAHDGLIAG